MDICSKVCYERPEGSDHTNKKPLPTNPIEKPGPTYVAARLPNTNASGSARPANENSENCRAARARTATNVSTVT